MLLESFHNLGGNKLSFVEKRLIFEDPPPTGPERRGPEDEPEKKPKSPEEAAEEVKRKRALEAEHLRGRMSIDVEQRAKRLEQLTTVQIENRLGGLNEWKVSVIRRGGVSPDNWELTSTKGLAAMKSDWEKMKIIGIGTHNNDLFGTPGVLGEYEKIVDEAFLSQVASPEARKAYRNPRQYKDKLEDLTGDKNFADAMKFAFAVEDVVRRQLKMQLKTEESLQKKDEEPLIEGAKDVIHDNVNAFQDAVKRKDWVTAGVYVGGLILLWKAYKTLPDDKQGWIGKGIVWGGALYAVNLYAKNTGVNLLEKFGFKDLGSDVEGTPLAAVYRFENPDIKSVDAKVLRDSAFINMHDLHKLYMGTGKDHPYIDPNKFPTAFPEFGGMHFSILRKTEDLDSKQKEYKRVANELYKLAGALQMMYNEKMLKPGEPSFDKALEGGVLKHSTVFDFMVAIQSYMLDTKQTSIEATLEQGNKLYERMREVFDGEHMGLDVVRAPFKPGMFDGRIMDYPVVFVRDTQNKRYVIFSKRDHEIENGNPHISKALATVSFEGGDKTTIVKGVQGKVTERVGNLVTIFESNAKATTKLSDLNYHSDGFWYATLAYEKGKLLKGTPKPVQVRVRPAGKGESLSVESLDNSILIHVEDVLDKGKLYGNLVLAEMVTQKPTAAGLPDMEALSWFYRAGKLKFIDNNPSDDTFEIQIGNVSIDGKKTISVKFNETTGQYTFVDATVEGRLLKNHNFRHGLAESIATTEKFRKPIDDLKALVRNTPESYLIHLIKNIPSWFSQGTWHELFRGIKLDHFTGSVAKNHVIALIDAQESVILSKLSLSLDNANKLEDISNVVNLTIPHSIKGFSDLSTSLSKANTRFDDLGDRWSAEEFDEDILRKLTEIGLDSSDYKVWYRRFVTKLAFKYGTDDLRKGNARKIAGLVKVFGYYTAPCDNPEQDGADLKATAAPAKDKADLYKLNAYYTDYVAEQIFKRMNSGAFDNISPEDPGAHWGIESYASVKATPGRYVTVPEWIDTREQIKMYKDYVTLDEYVKLSAADQAKIDDSSVILPRKSAKIAFHAGGTPERDNEKRVLKTLGMQSGTYEIPIENMRLTEFEDYYFKRLHEAVNHLRDKYGARTNEAPIQAFEKRFRMAYQWSLVDANTLDFKMGYMSSTGTFNEGTPELFTEIKHMESLFNGSGVTVTRGDQESAINRRVEQVVRGRLLTKENFGTYFKKTGVVRSMQNVWEDFSDWLWGLKNN